MLLWNKEYLAYDLQNGLAINAAQLDETNFAPEVLLDVRRSGHGLQTEVFNIINDSVIAEYNIPEVKGINKRFAGAFKIIGSPYGVLNVFYMNGLDEGYEAIEGHLIELPTGKFQCMVGGSIDHYQPKQNSLFLLHPFRATRIEFGEEIIIEDIVFLKNPLGLLRRWPVSAIASFPTNRNHMAFAQESTVYFVDILSPEEIPEDPTQIREYGTSLSSKVYAWSHINALCADDSGRYLYIGYNNGNFRVFDMQAKEFSEEYRMPTKIPKATRRGSRDQK